MDEYLFLFGKESLKPTNIFQALDAYNIYWLISFGQKITFGIIDFQKIVCQILNLKFS